MGAEFATVQIHLGGANAGDGFVKFGLRAVGNEMLEVAQVVFQGVKKDGDGGGEIGFEHFFSTKAFW